MVEKETENATAINEELAALLTKLQLDQCSFETIPLTREMGWLAPRGRAFKITGHFTENFDQSPGISNVAVALPSVELLEARQEEFPLDFTSPPTEFVGKWLCVQTDHNGREVCVRENPDFIYEDGSAYLINIDDHHFLAEGLSDAISVEWIQRYATGIIGNCDITLVEYPEHEAELFIPPNKTDLRRRSF